jgi:flagellar basal-body rod protein FlgG
VQNPNGTGFYYTRAGNFNLNANGELVLGSASNGYRLEPTITVPPEATGITVAPDGQLSYSTTASTDLQSLGQLTMAKFVNPDGLLKLGDNLYQKTQASGDEQTGSPGQDGFGNVRQGFLEASNVEPVNELIDLIQTQRSFELNSQVVQAGDQIMQIVANLRRA